MNRLDEAWKAYIDYTGGREFRPGLYLARYLELSPEYPMLIYKHGDESLILLSDFLWEGREALEAYRQGMDVTEVLGLFLEGVSYLPEAVCMLALEGNPKTPQKTPAGTIRPLKPLADSVAMGVLKRACSKEERTAGSVSLQDVWPTGFFAEGKLVAAASAWLWGDRLADLGVLTHGGYRRQGCGAAVVSAVAVRAIAEGRIPFYRCDAANTASFALAKSLGFAEIARGEGATVRYPE